MLNVLENVTCGGVENFAIDSTLPSLIRTIVFVIKVFIPIILIIYGMLDMGKAVIAGDEKVMKENQGKLIKRILYAALIFFIISIVQVVIRFVAGSDSTSIMDCISCFTTEEAACDPAN
jgi:hypothetical protein